MLVALTEIGWAIARPDRPVDVSRAADPVPHEDLRTVCLHGIVVGMTALVDVGVPIGAPLPGPVGPVMRVVAGLDPGALLETDHIEPGPREHGGCERAGRSRADDQDIAVLLLFHRFSPQFWVRLLSRSSALTSTRRTSSVGV